MNKKITGLILVFVFILTSTMSAFAMNREIGEEWVPIESQVCEHLPTGLDVIYQRLSADGVIQTKWECHDKSSVDDLIRPRSINDANTVVNAREEWDPCARTGCNGSITTSWTTTQEVISGTRVCPNHSVCLQVQYSWNLITTMKCNSCGWGTQAFTPQSEWRCR